jgi:hypothetical protein
MDLEQMSEEEVLTEAMKQGFNPEYEGDNKKSPREFLEVAFNHNKVLKERNDNLSQSNEELKEEIAILNRKMEQIIEFSNEQKQKAVEKAVRELTAQRNEAISDGDTELVQQLDKRIEDEKNVAISNSNPILDAWMKQNPWYIKDDELGLEADIIARQLQETGRFRSTEHDYQRLLDLVAKKVKSQFSERFKNPKKDNPPDVESARQSPVDSSKKTYADLPPDAKKACDQFVRDKVMTRERYLELYEWD